MPKSFPVFEFHIAEAVRKEYDIETALFSTSGNVILADFKKARELAFRVSSRPAADGSKRAVKSGELAAMGLIDEILHHIVFLYRRQVRPDVFTDALGRFAGRFGGAESGRLLSRFCERFPPQAVYAGRETVSGYLAGGEAGYGHAPMAVEEMLLLALANLNPAFRPFLFFFDDAPLKERTVYPEAIEELKTLFSRLPPFGPGGQNLWDMLRAPALASPDSLAGQIRWIREHWGRYLGAFIDRLLTGLDLIAEEEKPSWGGAPGPAEVPDYGFIAHEYERFSTDLEWMPRCILMAKTVLVWLSQLSKTYGRDITRLDHIPDEELDRLARRGFTGLWLIGLWERSKASRTIKQWKGNPEAAASAYSLYDYDIAAELGGWEALAGLRERCARRGIRLGSDMVPNHTGIDSRWIMEHPDRFLQLDYAPFPGYVYRSGDLSGGGDVVLQIEDHYYDNSDCAVVFHYYDKRTGRRRFIYHGNDGTSMPWNDTAQIDFLNPEAREAVIRTIVGVCRQFPIVRFDAAMTLAKKHIRRLWYPEPGRGGDIASRAEHALSTAEFNRRIPNEFWREVVDRCATEAPDTLLLAEAFWMMEGYFVRTLGMHRVYNSAFMNMLKNEDNQKYRDTIKNTISFDGEILKRFVNFMNNPDEETAVAQFGKGDKYFGICTLMVTMPGLPMFGHGQIEGFEEKYGMEYRRAYRDERPDEDLVGRHEREIFPLMKRRVIFSGSAHFSLFDFWTREGAVNENVFAYANRAGDDRALVLYNNAYAQTAGWIKEGAVAAPQKGGGTRRDSLAQALLLSGDPDAFVLLREHRQNRWFIRSCKELHESGLFVMLGGYEAQVFLDMREVRDGAGATWARLHAEKNGAPFGEPGEALDDMLMGPLYAPFMDALRRAARDEPIDGDAARFAEEVCAFVYGARGVEAMLPRKAGPDEAAAPKAARVPKAAPPPVPDAVARAACALYGRVDRAFYAYPLEGGPAAAPETLESDAAAARTIAAAFALLGAAEDALAAHEPAFSAPAFTRHFRLERKTGEALRAAGMEGGAAFRAARTVTAVLRARGAAKDRAAAARAGALSAAAVTKAAADGELRGILGINVWNGRVYFNRECFREAARAATLLLSSALGGPRLRAEQAALWEAEERSGYQVEALVSALGGPPADGTPA